MALVSWVTMFSALGSGPHRFRILMLSSVPPMIGLLLTWVTSHWTMGWKSSNSAWLFIELRRFGFGWVLWTALAAWFLAETPWNGIVAMPNAGKAVIWRVTNKGGVFKMTFKEFKRIWNGIFWKNDGMDSLVSKLKSRYPLYLISNTNHLHFEYLKENYPILQHFKKCFPSHEVGHRKPDPKIFRRALESSGLSWGNLRR